MCGISGIISDYSNLENSTSIVKKMIDKIHYRGPDDENICNCNNRAIFGHKRLKIVDFDNGIQPFFSKCKLRKSAVFSKDLNPSKFEG